MGNVVFLREVFDWMGEHSGYDQVCNAIIDTHQYQCYSIYRPKESEVIKSFFHEHLDDVILQKIKPNPFYHKKNLLAERKAILKSILTGAGILHINYVENNYALSSYPLILPKTKVIGTVHQPPEWYEENYFRKENLKKLDAIIILSSKVRNYFDRINPGKVFMIPHGIDTDFFKPVTISGQERKSGRILFSGHWLRDIKSLYLVAKEINKLYPEIHFDLLVPINKRYDDYFKEIEKLANIHWYDGLSDLELLNLYNEATLLFLPMIDCTANNAILESMACGNPIISNQVGGLSEYTDKSFATLFPAGDIKGFIDCISNLLMNPDVAMRQGQEARKYALTNFTWAKIAESTIDVYRNAGMKSRKT